MRKVLAIVLALTMVLGMSTVAFAGTSVSTTEDTSVLTLTSAGNTVSYQAVTVDGGIKDGVTYPDTTMYTYSVKTTAATAAVTASFDTSKYYIKVNNTSYTSSPATFNLSKNTHNELNVYAVNGSATEAFRTFDVAIVDANSVNVSIEINCYNTAKWLESNSSAVVEDSFLSLYDMFDFNDYGKMTSIINMTLPGGSSAMDALYELQDLKPGFQIEGTGNDGSGKVTYVSYINGLGEKQCGGWSGWCYTINNDANLPPYGAAQYKLSEGDHVTWVYTCNYSDIEEALK